MNILKSAYFQQRRVYKKLIKYKRHNFLENKNTDLWNLRGEALKIFWKKLKNRIGKPNLAFSNNQLSSYFSTLLQSEDKRDTNEHEISVPSIDTMTQNLIEDTLNGDISVEEVKQMAKNLKTGKASGQSIKTTYHSVLGQTIDHLTCHVTIPRSNKT